MTTNIIIILLILTFICLFMPHINLKSNEVYVEEGFDCWTQHVSENTKPVGVSQGEWDTITP